jgi:hypothetical protein
MRAQGMPVRHRLVLSQRCLSGEGKLPGASLLVRDFVLFVHVHGISHSKKSSYQAVLTHGTVMMLFRHVPRHGDVSSDRMDSLLECLVLGAHGFQLPRPVVASA